MWKLNIERTRLQDLLQFISLFEFLTLVPEFSELVGEGEQQSVAPIELLIRKISLRAAIPFSDSSVVSKACILRTPGGAKLRFVRHMAYVTAEVRLLADTSSQGGAMFRDQLFAPCTAEIKVQPSTVQVSIYIPPIIQVTISPLTVKTVARIALLAEQHFKQANELRKLSPYDSALQLALSGQDGRPNHLFNNRGIFLSLVAE